jgi:cytochrome c-type biogenesis protein CcmH/NrfF
VRVSTVCWAAAVAALALAVVAGWRDHRRRKRVDPDAVSAVDWRSVQMLALFACAILASVAFNA